MWRGATWCEPFLTGRSMIISGGMKAKLVLYPIFNDPARPNETLMNWVVCAKLGDGSTKLIKSTERNYVYPMCDREPLRRWTWRLVTLLGDAAHPMYPVGSNGASQAILDAVCLADCLAAQPPLEALKSYEGIRRPATTKLVRANRKGGPERVIDLVEERAPDGFDSLDDVASEKELTGLVGAYQSMAGLT